MKNYRFKKFVDNNGKCYGYRFHEVVIFDKNGKFEGVTSWYDDVEDFKDHLFDTFFQQNFVKNGEEISSINEVKQFPIELEEGWIEKYEQSSDVVRLNLNKK